MAAFLPRQLNGDGFRAHVPIMHSQQFNESTQLKCPADMAYKADEGNLRQQFHAIAQAEPAPIL